MFGDHIAGFLVITSFLNSKCEGGKQPVIENIGGNFADDFTPSIALEPLLKALESIMCADLIEISHGIVRR